MDFACWPFPTICLNFELHNKEPFVDYMSIRKLEINRTLILSDWSILVESIELIILSFLPNMSIIQLVTQTESINRIHPLMEKI